MQITNRVPGNLSGGGRPAATLNKARSPFSQRAPLVLHERTMTRFNDAASSPLGVCTQTPAGNRWTSQAAANSRTVLWPFSGSSAMRGLNVTSWFLRLEMTVLFARAEHRMADRGLRHCGISGGWLTITRYTGYGIYNNNLPNMGIGGITPAITVCGVSDPLIWRYYT